MSDDVMRIEKLENGYEVSYCDPTMMEENRNGKGSWKDPWKEYVFKTKDEVVEFIDKILDKLEPPPDEDEEYEQAFDEANKDEDD